MFLNYLKIAFRNIRRDPVFSLINIFGLSIGIGVAFVVYFLVQHDFSFDKFEPDGDRIYRVIAQHQFGSDVRSAPAMSYPMASAIQREATGVEEVTPLQKYYPETVSIPTSVGLKPTIYQHEGQIIFTDENYFKLITYQWLAGSPDVLQEPNVVVLTEQRAHRYFSHKDLNQIVGKEITFSETFTARVGGIVKDIDQNTDFDFTAFISLSTISNDHQLKTIFNWDKWNAFHPQVILKRYPESKPEQIQAVLNSIADNHRKEAYIGSWLPSSFTLQPLADIHFNRSLGGIDVAPVSKDTLYSLMGIALFLLLLGTFNFINLTTAQSLSRSREIGIRKTIGGSRAQLMAQFFTETFLITLLAGILSLTLLPFFFNIFSGFFPVISQFSLGNKNHFFIFFPALILLITFLSGWYPALLLSRFKPATVIRNAVVPSGISHKTTLRKVLITLQFIIAQVFIIFTFLMIKQTHFLLNKDLGFNQEAIVYFSVPRPHNGETDQQYAERARILLKKIREMPEVTNASLSSGPPAALGGYVSYELTIKKQQQEEKIAVTDIAVDSDYLKIYGFRLLAGSFSLRTDQDRLINETLLRKMGYKSAADAVGKPAGNYGVIAGVISDFNHRSLRYQIEPLMISLRSSPGNAFSILLKPQSPGNQVWKRAIGKIRKEWSSLYPNQAFNLKFLDETIASFYNQEQQLLKLLYWLTAIAIIISTLGLLGLVIYVTNRRTKEIGIRKILGASLQHLAYLLCKEFIVLIVLAAAIAIPIAWILIHKYLQQYAYRTALSWWVFMLSIVAMLLVTLITLIFRTLRTAKANPVESLRTE